MMSTTAIPTTPRRGRGRTLAAAVGFAAVGAFVLAGCSASDTTTTDGDSDLPRVAVLVPGQANDGSFNQRAVDALQKLEDEGKITFELREAMAVATDAEPVIRDFASQGFDLIIGHGLEISDPIFAVAAEFPDVDFTASGGVDVLDKATANVETWTYNSTEVGYLTGYIAGTSGISPLGVVESIDLPFVTATDDGFRAGVAETNPSAVILPSVFAGSFDDAQAAATATKSLVSQGAQLVFTTGDGIGAGVASGADEAGAKTMGVSLSAGAVAEKVNIATVDLDLYPQYSEWIEEISSDDFGDRSDTLSIANGGVVASAVAEATESLTGIQDKIDALVAGLADGSLTVPGE